jgi:uncharacterized protein (TIGR02452 family)
VLPIISVCPVKRPKLDSSGKKYSFKQEKELMKDKIRTALRIAIYYGYPNLCIGNFGLGPGFRNPPEEVATMWKDAFLRDSEFVGHFHDVVFAFEPEGLLTSIKIVQKFYEGGLVFGTGHRRIQGCVQPV